MACLHFGLEISKVATSVEEKEKERMVAFMRLCQEVVARLNLMEREATGTPWNIWTVWFYWRS